MNLNLKTVLLSLAFCVSATSTAYAQPAKAPWPEGAKPYIISPKDGDIITGAVTVIMGLKGLGVAPAGIEKEKTGHHHILIDVDAPKGDDLQNPLQLDENHRHFGGGQTETSLNLKTGTHTLQLIMGDHNHIPYNPPLLSDRITVIVK